MLIKNRFSTFLTFILIGIIVSGCNPMEQTTKNIRATKSNEHSSLFIVKLNYEESLSLQYKKRGTYCISSEEAIDKVMTIAEQKGGKCKNMTFSSCKLIENNNKKGAYYQVEFESQKGKGYAIIPADIRVPEPMCYVENGFLTDTSFIEPLKYYFRHIPEYIEKKQNDKYDIDKYYANAISKINNGTGSKSVPPFDPDVWTYDGFFIDTVRSYIDKIVPVEWGQEPPLGSLIDDDRGYCVIPAVAQIMAYHKFFYQGDINFTVSLWNSMIAGNNDASISTLGANLYDDLYWLFDYIVPFPSDICSFFQNELQCTTSSYHTGFDYLDLLDYLITSPVIILGFSGPMMSNLSNGHYWIADAAEKIEYQPFDAYHIMYNGNRLDYYIYYNATTTEEIHFNWGWANSSNGWFESGDFSPYNNDTSYEYGIVVMDIVP